MAGICFHFENIDVDVWSGHDLDAWNYAAKACGDIDEIIVINHTEKVLKNPDIDKFRFSVVNKTPQLKGDVVSLVPPWQCKTSGTSLWNFSHNVDWYYFGPASSPLIVQGEEVFVPQVGVGALHAVHIASVVLMHRFGVKSWQ